MRVAGRQAAQRGQRRDRTPPASTSASAYVSSSDSGTRRRRRRAAAPRTAAGSARMCSASGVPGAKPAHSSPGSTPSARAQRLDLRGAGHRRVVQRIAGERQAPALDRVGEDHRRPVALLRGRGVGVEDRAPGRDRRRRRRVRPARRRPRRRAAGRARRRARRPAAVTRALRSAAGRHAQQPLVLGVATSPPVGRAAARRRAARSAPAGAGPSAARRRASRSARNISASWRGPRVGHDAIEALAIDVDDPQHVAEPAARPPRRAPPRRCPRRARRRRPSPRSARASAAPP